LVARCFCYIAEPVSELVSISTPALTDNPGPPPSRETKRHLLAALFSAIAPGAGQLFLGQRRKGTALLLALIAVLIGFWPLRLLRFYPGFLLLFCGWTILYLYAACSAHLARNLPKIARPSRWWLVAILPVTILTLSLLGRTVTRISEFRSFIVPSISMERTILKGDELMADMRYYHSRHPDRKDVVIFLRDRDFSVKRIIAVGGDSIQGKDNVIFVNGKEQDEPYVEHNGPQAPDWMKNFGPVSLPKDKCFVMGDNRDVSYDSRSAEAGLVDNASIVGKPLYVFASGRAGKNIR
jgi:signal peptidase I